MKAVVLGALAILAATAGFVTRKLFAKKPAVSGKIFSAAPKAKESDSVVPRREDIAQIDILKILKFQSEILFEECTKYDSTLYLNFPPQLPRHGAAHQDPHQPTNFVLAKRSAHHTSGSSAQSRKMSRASVRLLGPQNASNRRRTTVSPVSTARA